jgi:hypothetical protein
MYLRRAPEKYITGATLDRADLNRLRKKYSEWLVPWPKFESGNSRIEVRSVTAPAVLFSNNYTLSFCFYYNYLYVYVKAPFHGCRRNIKSAQGFIHKGA